MDGKREETKLYQHTLAQTRLAAESTLRKGNGRYTEVDIRTGDGHVETLHHHRM
jgi:hypothetical protein